MPAKIEVPPVNDDVKKHTAKIVKSADDINVNTTTTAQHTIETANLIKESIAVNHAHNNELVKVLKKGFGLDEFEYLKAKTSSEPGKEEKSSGFGDKILGALGITGAMAYLSKTKIGKAISGLNAKITGTITGIGTKIGGMLPASVTSALTKVFKFGVGKIFLGLTAAWNFSEAFRDPEFSKKLVGGSTLVDKIHAGALNMLSGLTLGIFSPEEIKKGTDKLREATQPLWDKLFDLLINPIKSVTTWIEDKYNKVKSNITAAKEQVQELAGSKVAGSKIQERAVAGRETTVDIAAGKLRGITSRPIQTTEGLGSLSALYESGKKGSEAIGWDSTGGTSYGKYQIATKTGTMDQFMLYLKENNPEAYKRLSAAGPADSGKEGAFAQEWQKLAKEGGLGTSEHEFIKKTHFDVAEKGLKDPKLAKLIEKNTALQDVLWSTSVQHGGKGASSIFNKVYKEGMSEEDLIKAVYAERGTKFGRSTEAVQQSVAGRFQEEQKRALAMLDEKLINPVSAKLNSLQPETKLDSPAAINSYMANLDISAMPQPKTEIKNKEVTLAQTNANKGNSTKAPLTLASIPMIPNNQDLAYINLGIS